jgi:nucleoside-diphosphate-sugar epimerase
MPFTLEILPLRSHPAARRLPGGVNPTGTCRATLGTMRRVLVTGAAGRIGRAVLAALRTEDIDVTALVLQDPGDLDVAAVVVGSAADPDVVRLALRGCDGVIHLAAIPVPYGGTPLQVFGGNVSATFVVLDEAGRAGIGHAVIAGSYSATGLPFAQRLLHPAYVPVDMDLPPQVEDCYALSKQVDELTARMAHRAYGLNVVVLRYPYVGGFGDRLPKHAALVERELEIGARDMWSYLESRDAARAAVLGLGVDGFHAFYVAAPQTLSPYGTEELLDRFHPHAERRTPLPGRTVPLDLAPAREILGFTAEFELDIVERPLPPAAPGPDQGGDPETAARPPAEE